MASKHGRRTILVTGGAGFIGSHLVECLLEQDEIVRVLDNFSTGKREHLGRLGNLQGASRNLEVIEGDIRNYSVVAEACEGVDAILHQAALGSVPRSVEDPMTTQQVNADGTLNVFIAAKEHGISRVVYASSSSVYGDSAAQRKREGEEGAVLSPYALTKKNNEEYGRLFEDLYGLETVGLRYFNVYGPRQDPNSQYAAVIPRFVSALLSGSRPIVYGTGLQSRDFTFVRDVVEANLLAVDAPRSACGKAYNVGRGGNFSLLDLLAVLQEIIGNRIEPLFEAPRPGDVMHSSADISLASEVLGYRPRYGLQEGLEVTVEWYREQIGITVR
ncbi:MAG: SDR family oxidoreductase [Desulfomonile sp.]|nr:SDR family oxidoreductase [Desulfomonile sp.]